MPRFSKLFSAAACAVLLVLPASAFSENIGPVKIIRMSGEVFTAAIESRDPLLMIAAAKLRKSAGLQAVDRNPDGGAYEAPEGGILGWQQMLEAAATLSVGDPTLTGLIEDVLAESTKGVASGPVYSIVKIRSGGSDVYGSIRFVGGKYAEVYVEGKGTSDLNLFVYDAQDRLVCSDTDISDIAYCGWRPATTDTFTVTVKNKGGSGNQYSLITN